MSLQTEEQIKRNQEVAHNTLLGQVRDIVDASGLSVMVSVVYSDDTQRVTLLDEEGNEDLPEGYGLVIRPKP